MGIGGAAVATLFSQCVSFLILFAFFLAGKSVIKLSVKRISRSADIYLNIIKCGLPTLTRQGLASIATTVLSVTAAAWGDAAIAAMNIATKIYLFVRSMIIGIGQGFQPVAGFNYGAKIYSRVKSAFVYTVILGTAVCAAAAVLIGFNTQTFIAFFRKNDAEVIAIGSKALFYYALVLPLLAYSTFVNQILQCLGKSKRATFLASCRQGIFYLPLILILPVYFGVTGIELTQPLADLFTFIISVPFQIRFFKNGLKDSSKPSALETDAIKK
jgi:Na+-driven multidrug efflux pump